MRGTIPRARHSWRLAWASQALSACSSPGRRRGGSRRPRTGGMASRVGANIRVSWRLAALRQKPSGVPRASVTMWRFVPGLPRSVGFGPAAGPLFGPGQMRCPGKPGASRSDPPREAAPEARDAGGSTRPPLAYPATAASNSCRSRNPSRPAASPTAGQSAARTGCPSVRPGSQWDDARPSDGAKAAGGAERSHPRDHRGEAVWPCQTNAAHPAWCRSVRRSKSVGTPAFSASVTIVFALSCSRCIASSIEEPALFPEKPLGHRDESGVLF